MGKIAKWPVEEGRYIVGRRTASVAVCTEATVSGIKIDMNKVAIIGKCVTENVGVEKLVKNVISNPYIRFLIVCGKNSKGHDVGQTLLALSKNGIDNKMRVIGSTGAIPLLKHLTKGEIECFQKQVLLIDMQGEINSQKIRFKVEQCLRKNPGKFSGKPVKIKKLVGVKKIKCIKAQAFEKKYIADPKGSFQITIDKEKQQIVTQHYDSDLELDAQITGKTAQAISDTIVKMGLIGEFSESKDHAAYLGRELAKAETCLKNELDYVQDEPVIIIKNKKGLTKDDFGW